VRIRHDPVSTPMQQAAGRVLLTGATGYVGGRLLRKLEESGRPVRCMVRRPEALSGRTAEQTEMFTQTSSSPTLCTRPSWVSRPPTTSFTRLAADTSALTAND